MVGWNSAAARPLNIDCYTSLELREVYLAGPKEAWSAALLFGIFASIFLNHWFLPLSRPWASVHKSNSNPPVQWWRPDPHRSTLTVLYGWSLQTTTSVAEAVASWACVTLNFVTDAHSNETLPAGFMDLSVLRVVRETGQAAERAYSVFEVRISIKKWSYPAFISSVILMPLLFISHFEKFKEKENKFANNL